MKIHDFHYAHETENIFPAYFTTFHNAHHSQPRKAALQEPGSRCSMLPILVTLRTHMFMKCNLHRIPPPHKSRVDIIHWCSRCGYGWVHVWEHRLLKFMTAHCCLYFFACCRVQGIWSRLEEVGAAQRMLCCFHRNSRCILCHPDHARCHLGHCSFPMFSTPAPKQKYQLLIPKERLD